MNKLKQYLTRKSYVVKSISLLFIISCAIYACSEKSDNRPFPQTTGSYSDVVVTMSDSDELRKQMIWISKGIAGIADQSSTVKTKIRDLILPDDYFTKSHESLDQDLYNSLTFDFDSEVDLWLANNISPNDYDPSYFFEIDFENCVGKVVLRIPEADIANTSLTHVVTPEGIIQENEETMGYLINSLGNIDSVLLNDDNIDDFYVWVVGADFDCEPAPKDPCGNGICEPEIGETPENCEDCEANRIPDPGQKQFKLVLKDLHIKTDVKRNGGGHPGRRYQEAHLQGKYEVKIAQKVVDWNLSKERARRFRELDANKNTTNDYIPVDKYKSWGNSSRCEIKRHNAKRGKSNRGKEWTDHVNITLVNDYIPEHDDYIFALFEYDYFSKSWTHHDSLMTNGRAWSFVANQNNGSQDLTGGEYEEGWLVIDKIPNFATSPGVWVKVSVAPDPDVYEATFTLDGEMNVTFRIEEI